MSVSFQCPSCLSSYSVADKLVGRRVRCPVCDALNEVPPELAPADEPEPVEKPSAIGTRPPRFKTDPAWENEAVELAAVDIVDHEDVAPAMGAVGHVPSFPRPPKLVDENDPDDVPPPRKSRLGDTEMDMTPMVDVTFQLLIFFMITAAFALQKAKEIPKPQQEEPSTNVVQEVPEEATDVVIVRIDEFNTFTVIDTNQDEEEAPSVQDLYVKLRRAKTVEVGGKAPIKMRVESHGDALHEKVVAALDAGNETGFAEIELTTASEEADFP